MGDDDRNAFERASQEKSRGLVTELIDFLRDNRKYYLIPLVLILLALGLILILGGTAAAPFIYTLF
jgi:hypothetical protein